MTKRATTITADTRPLLTPAQLVEHLALDPVKGLKTLSDWRFTGTGPRFVKPDYHKVRYRPADVEAWLEARTFQRTDDRHQAA